MAGAIFVLSLLMLIVDREGPVTHSAIPGGLAAGWLYSNLLGFGRTSWLERFYSVDAKPQNVSGA